MNRLVPIALAMVSMACVPAVATAREAVDNRTGPYVGAGYGRFRLKLDTLDRLTDATTRVRRSDDDAWKVFVGYRFLPWLRLEGAYIDFGSLGESFDAGGRSGGFRVSMNGFSPSLIAGIPVGPVEFFAKVGQYYYDVDTRIDLDPAPTIRTHHSRSDFLWGGGVSAVVMDRLELRLEYDRVDIKNADDSNALWLSAAWRF